MHGEERKGLRLIGHHDLGGFGDGMQPMRHGDVMYVGHFGVSRMGTSILDVSDPRTPSLIRQWPAPEGAHTHKVQVADGLLCVNHEAFRGGVPQRVGIAVYSLEDPTNPREIGFWDSGGKGVHRIVWEGGRFAYVSATPDGFDQRIWVVVDLTDPSRPVERARWWWPGMADGETRDWTPDETRSVHHAMVRGSRAYLGFWDSGMVILDIADLDDIRVVARLTWDVGGHTHTALPLGDRPIVAVTDEATFEDCQGPPHLVRLVDITDETDPRVRSICPEPAGDYCARGLRYGAHCLHENRPDSYRSDTLIFATWFNAGLRVYDTAVADQPTEVGSYVPASPPGQKAIQVNDVFVDSEMFVHITDRVSGGLYILEPEPDLRLLMEQRRTDHPKESA
ncbi:MAG: LVIVD repeat-containing protein [Acidimicrobiia bacterium]